jgi:TetR/AcrR family transcriptional regulator, transcriptional repressor for nem operon
MMMMDIILTVKHSGYAVGHSKEDKADSHERIVRTAAARFREQGVDGIGVADLMKEAGLTHGGFYRHFESRDELVAEAVERALRDGGQGAASLEQRLHEGGSVAPEALSLRKKLLWGALVDGYLSLAHRDNLATSCAVTTLAQDVARSSERARLAYSVQVEAYLALFTQLIAVEKGKKRRTKAIAALATLVGAVSMARAVSNDPLSQEILKSAADELKSQLT